MNIPLLHVICTDDVLARPDFPDRGEELLDAGAESLALHLRPRSLPVRDCLDTTRRLSGAGRRSGGWLLVNGRVDLALVAGARGVQLGRGALPIAAARRLLGPQAAIGASVHGHPEAVGAVGEGADFLLLGTIFPTPSHPGGPIAGLDAIAACSGTGLPVVGIGGIDASRVAAVIDAGAHGVAAIRAIWEAPRPVEAALEMLGAILSSRAARPGTPLASGTEQQR